MSRRIISAILLLTILTMSVGILVPQNASADIGQSVAQAGGCIGSGILAGWLSGLINNGLQSLQKKITDIGSKYLKSLLGSFFGGLIGSDVPVQDESTEKASQSIIAYWQNRDYRDMIIARCLARLQIDNITSNISNIVKTRGRDGGPSFVNNWRVFLTQSQYRGENVFRAMLSTSNLCSYFSNDVKKTYGLKPTDKKPLVGTNTRSDSLQTFSTQINCTLPKDFTLDNYQKDFVGNGGWGRYAQLTQVQNNAYGANLIAQDQLAIQRNLEQAADTAQVQSNKGYKGSSGNSKSDSCKIQGFGGECIVFKDIKTTGEYLADSEAATVGANFQWLTSAQGLNTIIEDVTQNMINRLFDQSNNEGYATGGSDITVNGASPTPIGGGKACIDPAFYSLFFNTIYQQLLDSLNKITLDVDPNDPNLVLLDDTMIGLNNLKNQEPASQQQTISDIGELISDLQQFESIARDNHKTASDRINLDNARDAAIKKIESMKAEPQCTATPTTP